MCCCGRPQAYTKLEAIFLNAIKGPGASVVAAISSLRGVIDVFITFISSAAAAKLVSLVLPTLLAKINTAFLDGNCTASRREARAFVVEIVGMTSDPDGVIITTLLKSMVAFHKEIAEKRDGRSQHATISEDLNSKRLAFAESLTAYVNVILTALPAASTPLPAEQRRIVSDKVKKALFKLVNNASADKAIEKQEMLAHAQTYASMDHLVPGLAATFDTELARYGGKQGLRGTTVLKQFKEGIAANAAAALRGEVQLA